MGNKFSFFHEEAKAKESSSAEKSQVISFESSDEWRTHFESFKETDKLMVIDFSASWCGPCKMMEPVIHSFSAEYADVVFAKIDVDKLAEVAREFGIEAMPTFILIKKGKQVDKLRGANKEELRKKIEKHRGRP